MWGLPWADKYLPIDWFSNEIDNDEKYFEVASMTDERKERILWLGHRIAALERWLTYDASVHRFGVVSKYEELIYKDRGLRSQRSCITWKVTRCIVTALLFSYLVYSSLKRA